MRVFTIEEQEWLHQMLRSPGWSLYLETMIPELHRVAKRLDHSSQEDFQKYQGLKEGLTLAIETPYKKLGKETPFDNKLEALYAQAHSNIPDRAPAPNEMPVGSSDIEKRLEYSRGSHPV